MPIQHTVLVKFKPDTTQDQQNQWVKEAQKLGELIPQAKGVNAGLGLPHPASKGFDAGLSVVFNDQAAYDIYGPHDAHVAFKAFAGDIVEDKIIFDWEI
jgi:hypothetical protein